MRSTRFAMARALASARRNTASAVRSSAASHTGSESHPSRPNAFDTSLGVQAALRQGGARASLGRAGGASALQRAARWNEPTGDVHAGLAFRPEPARAAKHDRLLRRLVA